MESIVSIVIVSITFCLWLPLFLFPPGSKTDARHEYYRQIVVVRKFLRSFKRMQPAMSLRKTG